MDKMDYDFVAKNMFLKLIFEFFRQKLLIIKSGKHYKN